MDEATKKNFEAISDELARGQGRYFGLLFIVQELAEELAKHQKDPQKFITKLHERVSRRVDQFPTDDERVVGPEAREVIDSFFTNVGRVLAKNSK